MPRPWARALRVAAMLMHEKGSGREMTRTRCDRGAEIAAMLGFTSATREAIRTLDEHWDGNGMPDGLSGAAIPLLGRIVSLAQTAEVFASTFGVDAAIEMAVRAARAVVRSDARGRTPKSRRRRELLDQGTGPLTRAPPGSARAGGSDPHGR